ncbi:hypothetical protein [Enterocloster clostridioformis]|uniref:hypothetical protein n=1 Tax=Enterocloster clostridioformis TaxID=1531 RepID=UPI0034A17EA2
MRNNDYYNAEGYHDPTAGAVFAACRCDRKERSDRRKAKRKVNAKARRDALKNKAAASENGGADGWV